MLVKLLSAVALSATSACAYENSSPFFLYSTSNPQFTPLPDLCPASSIDAALRQISKSCPTSNYLIVSQPGVSSGDFSTHSTPLLDKRIRTTVAGQTSITTRDVVGEINVDAFIAQLAQSCAVASLDIDVQAMVLPDHDTKGGSYAYVELGSITDDLTPAERRVVLMNHDEVVANTIERYYRSSDYTLIYTTTSHSSIANQEPAVESEEYHAEMPLADMLHNTELRRSISKRDGKSSTNQTLVDGPLFDKYQFFTPGIFMGLVVGLILLFILYVGISALTSLQVTYAAFDKEQGQLAAKKAQ